MYRKICVAVDGSESSLVAVRTASALAEKFSSELLLLHVIRDMKVPAELQRYISAANIGEPRHAALQEVGEEILTTACQQAKQAGVASVRSKILGGDPASTIVQGARDESADLIVLGSRGLGKVEGMLIGSVSRKIADISDMSLLIVK